MKSLRDMTREELWALDACDVWELYYKEFGILEEDTPLNTDDARADLDTLRLELQQDAADARNDTNHDR